MTVLNRQHKDPKVIDKIIVSLDDEYDKTGKMTVRQGKIHEYLGMTLDFSRPGKFIMDMEQYIDEVMKDLPKEFGGMVETPAALRMFKTRSGAGYLDQETAELFHHLTAQLLFLGQRGRPDIRNAVSFLCTRVKSPYNDDYKKLHRLIKYLRKTKFLRLTMEANRLDQNEWFIDAAFAVNKDMRSHTGAYMTFGRGMMNGASNKQKINTTSST